MQKLVFVFAVLFAIPVLSGATEPVKKNPINAKYAEFTKLMDGYEGEPGTLQSAKKLLGEMLQSKQPSPLINVAMGRLALAEGFKNYGEYDTAAIKKAEKNFSFAIFADPHLFDAFLYGAYAYLYEDNFPIAEFFSEKAEKNGPVSPELSLLYAEIALRKRNYESALKITGEILSKNQEGEVTAKAYLISARVYFAQGKYDLAEAAFLKLLQLKPESPWIIRAYSSFLIEWNQHYKTP